MKSLIGNDGRVVRAKLDLPGDPPLRALCKLHKRQLVKIIVFYRNSCVSRQRALDAIEGIDSGTERMFPNSSGIINQTMATLDCDYWTVGRQLARIARENLNTFSPFSVRSLSKLRDANAGRR